MMDSRRRLQVRVTLDSDMGPLFVWASAIPERARARELVGLLRVGYAISAGHAIPATVVAREPHEWPANPPARTTATESARNLEHRGAEATLEIFDATAVTGVPPP